MLMILRLRLFLSLSTVIAVPFFTGCRTYAWSAFKWNCLSSTPYLHVSKKPKPLSWDDDRVTACWIGQSTVLVNMKGTTLLTDPVLAKRIAPVHLGGHINLGIRRITELPLKFKELPPVDVILLSHAHYDHWDVASLKYFGEETTVVIPAGTRDLLPRRPYKRVVTLKHGAETQAKGVTIRAFPVEHWGGRTFKDPAPRKCNGYLITRGPVSIVFIGDSTFRNRDTWLQAPVDWGRRIGTTPVDLCLLPISIYTYHLNHMTPEEAWKLSRELDSTWFMPIHWRTFIQAPPKVEPYNEPIRRLKHAAGSETNRIVCEEPGNVFVLPE